MHLEPSVTDLKDSLFFYEGCKEDLKDEMESAKA